ncbi:hypothetical protein K445DRAFT_39582, partial [Daldinia sp. EC12]
LFFWNINNYKFPILNILIKKYLTIPVIFITMEKVFSVLNNIITKNRNKLLLNTVKQLILLKYWKINNI